jgi:hypothetical protein
VHVVLSGERVRPKYVAAVPDVAESVSLEAYQVLSLESTERMKLTSYHDKDNMLVRDMIGVRLVDATWSALGLSVEKASHGPPAKAGDTGPLVRPHETPRVSWVDGGRLLRPQTCSTVFDSPELAAPLQHLLDTLQVRPPSFVGALETRQFFPVQDGPRHKHPR